MTSSPRRHIRVLSSKYDGAAHNDYVAELIEDGRGEAPLRLFVPQGTTIHSYRGDYPARVPFTGLFWPGEDCWSLTRS